MKTNQSIIGLEAAYLAVFDRPLRDRVIELVDSYTSRIDATCTELNPDGVVPCMFKLSELAEHYKVQS